MLNGLTFVIAFWAMMMLTPAMYGNNASQSAASTVSSNSAKNSKPQTKSASKNKERKNSSGISPKREKLAIEFANLHHAELAKLIQRLKKHKPREYKRAIRDLDITLNKLERFKKRDSERYRLTLERWKVDSRIRLLAARVSVRGGSSDKSELKTLLKKRVDLKLALLKNDRQLAEKRIEKINKSISEIENNRDKVIDAEFIKINRSIRKPVQKNKKQK